MGNVGKGLILRLVVFDYLVGSNYLNSFGLIRGWLFKTICSQIRTIKITVVYSQCLRCRLLISDDTEFRKALQSLKLKLRIRGYPKSLINYIFQRVAGLKQADLVYRIKNTKSVVTPFIIPYGENTNNISCLFKQPFH